jgi:hypothetical protein
MNVDIPMMSLSTSYLTWPDQPSVRIDWQAPLKTFTDRTYEVWGLSRLRLTASAEKKRQRKNKVLEGVRTIYGSLLTPILSDCIGEIAAVACGHGMLAAYR